MSVTLPDSELPNTESRRRACAHCGLPATVRGDHTDAGNAGRVFCCSGCHGAYQLIHGWGLEAFYDLRVRSPEDGPVDASTESFADLDDPALLGLSAPVEVGRDGKSMRLSKLSISGLHCAACVWLLERAPQQISGWQSSKIDYHARTVEVVFDPATIKLSDIARFVNRLGYTISPLSNDSLDQQAASENRTMLIDIAVAGFCAANAMWVAIALYAGQFSGMAAGYTQLFRIAGVLLGAIAVVFPGRVFFRSALASITTRSPHMDLPVAVGLTAGLLASLYGLFDPTSDVYFDSIAALVFFLLTGRWIQMRQQRRAGDAVAGLLRMSPLAATRVEPDGTTSRVAIDALRVGDRVATEPSASIPVDGRVVAGESLIDRSLLTGESRPVAVRPGSQVEAGTDNLQATLTIKATAVGDNTRLASLRAAVADAAATRTPIVQLANRIGGWFVSVVLLLATLTAIAWSWIAPQQAVGNSVALLIVACPCALALATPLAIAVAIGRLANRRVLIRAGDCLERLSSAGTIFFDKTGTLTAGTMSVNDWIGDETVLPAVAAIESDIRHPVARALVAHASPSPASLPATEINQVPGLGVEGIVDGVKYVIGNAALLSNHAVLIEAAWSAHADRIAASGSSPVWVAKDSKVAAVCGVSDRLRDDAADVIKYFVDHGWQVGILSGDDSRTVAGIGDRLGLQPAQSRGGLLPEQKLAAIHASGLPHPIVMVGDGVNDAAALAAADVGVAIRGGASASLTAAPVMIGNGQLHQVISLLQAANSTRRSIRRNFAISIGYNLVAVGLAMTGMITPLIAAVLMPLSSISVIAFTLSGRTVTESAA